MVRYLVLALCSLLIGSPWAAGADTPGFEPELTYWNILRDKFPAAFASYRDPSWLFLTEEAIWTKDGLVLPLNVTIEAQKTAVGHRRVNTDDQVSIEAEYDIDRRARRVDLERVYLAPQFSGAYAWRVLIAEFLLKYDVDRWRITIDSADVTPDVATCGDLLAQGHDPFVAYGALPVTRAMDAFGFQLDAGDVFEHDDAADAEVHYPGQLTLRLDYRRQRPRGASAR